MAEHVGNVEEKVLKKNVQGEESAGWVGGKGRQIEN